jgi:hypothetical protein
MDLLAVARTECFLGSWMVEKLASTVFTIPERNCFNVGRHLKEPGSDFFLVSISRIQEAGSSKELKDWSFPENPKEGRLFFALHTKPPARERRGAEDYHVL